MYKPANIIAHAPNSRDCSGYLGVFTARISGLMYERDSPVTHASKTYVVFVLVLRKAFESLFTVYPSRPQTQ